MGQPITGPADPRWVLATRTAEQLEGDVLRAESRAALIRLGRLMGLSIFDANLIVAIVQDQARRGRVSERVAEEAEAQLALVELPLAARVSASLRRRKRFTIGFLMGLALGIEVLVMSWLLL
jgi:hypothetical protein